VFASAQHPIALGALFAMVIPIGLALGYGVRRFWFIPTGIVGLGVMATGSRTPITMLAVATIVFLWLRPVPIKKLWPLVLRGLTSFPTPLPGARAPLRAASSPAGGSVARQPDLAVNAVPPLAGGRIARSPPRSPSGPTTRSSVRGTARGSPASTS